MHTSTFILVHECIAESNDRIRTAYVLWTHEQSMMRVSAFVMERVGYTSGEVRLCPLAFRHLDPLTPVLLTISLLVVKGHDIWRSLSSSLRLTKL